MVNLGYYFAYALKQILLQLIRQHTVVKLAGMCTENILLNQLSQDTNSLRHWQAFYKARLLF